MALTHIYKLGRVPGREDKSSAMANDARKLKELRNNPRLKFSEINSSTKGNVDGDILCLKLQQKNACKESQRWSNSWKPKIIEVTSAFKDKFKLSSSNSQDNEHENSEINKEKILGRTRKKLTASGNETSTCTTLWEKNGKLYRKLRDIPDITKDVDELSLSPAKAHRRSKFTTAQERSPRMILAFDFDQTKPTQNTPSTDIMTKMDSLAVNPTLRKAKECWQHADKSKYLKNSAPHKSVYKKTLQPLHDDSGKIKNEYMRIPKNKSSVESNTVHGHVPVRNLPWNVGSGQKVSKERAVISKLQQANSRARMDRLSGEKYYESPKEDVQVVCPSRYASDEHILMKIIDTPSISRKESCKNHSKRAERRKRILGGHTEVVKEINNRDIEKSYNIGEHGTLKTNSSKELATKARTSHKTVNKVKRNSTKASGVSVNPDINHTLKNEDMNKSNTSSEQVFDKNSSKETDNESLESQNKASKNITCNKDRGDIKYIEEPATTTKNHAKENTNKITASRNLESDKTETYDGAINCSVNHDLSETELNTSSHTYECDENLSIYDQDKVENNIPNEIDASSDHRSKISNKTQLANDREVLNNDLKHTSDENLSNSDLNACDLIKENLPIIDAAPVKENSSDSKKIDQTNLVLHGDIKPQVTPQNRAKFENGITEEKPKHSIDETSNVNNKFKTRERLSNFNLGHDMASLMYGPTGVARYSDPKAGRESETTQNIRFGNDKDDVLENNNEENNFNTKKVQSDQNHTRNNTKEYEYRNEDFEVAEKTSNVVEIILEKGEKDKNGHIVLLNTNIRKDNDLESTASAIKPKLNEVNNPMNNFNNKLQTREKLKEFNLGNTMASLMYGPTGVSRYCDSEAVDCSNKLKLRNSSAIIENNKIYQPNTVKSEISLKTGPATLFNSEATDLNDNSWCKRETVSEPGSLIRDITEEDNWIKNKRPASDNSQFSSSRFNGNADEANYRLDQYIRSNNFSSAGEGDAHNSNNELAENVNYKQFNDALDKVVAQKHASEMAKEFGDKNKCGTGMAFILGGSSSESPSNPHQTTTTSREAYSWRNSAPLETILLPKQSEASKYLEMSNAKINMFNKSNAYFKRSGDNFKAIGEENKGEGMNPNQQENLRASPHKSAKTCSSPSAFHQNCNTLKENAKKSSGTEMRSLLYGASESTDNAFSELTTTTREAFAWNTKSDYQNDKERQQIDDTTKTKSKYVITQYSNKINQDRRHVGIVPGLFET